MSSRIKKVVLTVAAHKEKDYSGGANNNNNNNITVTIEEDSISEI